MKRCPEHNVYLVWDESTIEEEYTGFGFSTRTYRLTRYVCPFVKDGCRTTHHETN